MGYNYQDYQVRSLDPVDKKRIEIINKFNTREKAAMAIGLGYHRAYYVSLEMQRGWDVSASDIELLENVNWALKILNEETL